METETKHKNIAVRLLSLLLQVVLYGLLFLGIWHIINPLLYFFYPETYAYTTPDSRYILPDFLQTWGGSLPHSHFGALSDYYSTFLVGCYAIPWAGALLLTLMVIALTLLTGECLKSITGKSAPFARYIPAMILLTLFARYALSPVFPISLIIGLAGFVLYMNREYFPVRRQWSQSESLFLFIIVAVVIALLSVRALPLFFILSIIYMLVRDKSAGRALWTALFGVSLLIGVFARRGDGGSFAVVLSALSCVPVNAAAYRLNYILLFCSPLLIAVALLAVHKKTAGITEKRNVLLLCGRIAGCIVVLVSAAAFVVRSYDPLINNQYQINYYMITGQWSKLLAEADKRSPGAYTQRVTHVVDRALFHEHRLLDDMLDYPQSIDALLFDSVQTMNDNGQFWRRVWGGPTFLELGMVNYAENVTMEALASMSYYPAGRLRLAQIAVAKNMPQTAVTYLSGLTNDYIYGTTAKGYLARLALDSALSADSVIAAIRLNIPQHDTAGSLTPEDLLAITPHNVMAFEYLVAAKLLTADLDGVAATTRYLPVLGYTHLPRLYEESLILYRDRMHKQVDLKSFQLSKESLSRYDDFCTVLNKYGGSNSAARPELMKKFGNTYFYYFFYGAVKGQPS